MTELRTFLVGTFLTHLLLPFAVPRCAYGQDVRRAALREMLMVIDTAHSAEVATPMGIAEINKEVEALASGRVGEQQAAIHRLAHAGTPAIPALLEVMETHKKFEVRTRAADALALIIRMSKDHDETLLARLAKLANSADYFMASPALTCMLEFKGSEQATDLLQRIAKTSGSPQVRMEALGSLMVVASSSLHLAPFMREFLRDPGDEVRAVAAGLLGRLGDKSGLPVCLEILERDPVDFRVQKLIGKAASSAGEIGDPSLIPALEKILKNAKASWPHADAYKAIAEIRLRGLSSQAEKLQFLQQKLQERIYIQWAAIELKRIGTPEALAVLRRAAEDPTHPGRAEASTWLQGNFE